MKVNNTHLIYFSPTGTTQKVVNAIAEGLKADKIQRYDLTFPVEKTKIRLMEGVAVIGAPVYAGRIPVDVLERLSLFQAENIPSILVALYGNREFEDALVELRDVVTAQGFNVIAAGAFIGEHSYSTKKHPIAVGRPDHEDLKLAETFGQQIALKIKNKDFHTPAIEGNIPYKERIKFGGVAPETDGGTCTLCGTCAEVCPVRIITVTNTVATKADNCIMCCACIKSCRFGARVFKHPVIQERTELLVNNCSVPKSPKIFI
ncbi:4Fe-4S binding protein [uncultured Desulfuromusa sp.]|uniref:4Fe-4S binding protein n=1 Tax=uncultured Desulfuromusa sp. TaxID=219183 RepID=UPI002AA83D09|nr:4Fe-4S binding protein [uncultured Desulfuromusa sp.]